VAGGGELVGLERVADGGEEDVACFHGNGPFSLGTRMKNRARCTGPARGAAATMAGHRRVATAWEAPPVCGDGVAPQFFLTRIRPPFSSRGCGRRGSPRSATEGPRRSG
jgi:hypothetical protein